MPSTSVSSSVNVRAVAIGLGVFVAAVVVVPVLVVLVASVGPRAWIPAIAPYVAHKHVFAVAAGAITVLLSKKSSDTLLVATLGGFIVLSTALLFGSLRDTTVWERLQVFFLEPALWCGIGGTFVALLRKATSAL